MNHYPVEQFLQLEIEVWDALVSGDAATDDRLLTDDFLGVYNSGFAGKAEHVGQLKGGATVSSYKLSDARIKVLSNDMVLLSYFAQWARCKNGVASDPEAMYVTSIWQCFGEIWRNVFSQDTPADE